MVTNEMILAFLNIMEYGNLTSAARNTYTTQSNLSKQIAMLEKELGAPLLIRAKGHSGVSLTPYGKEFMRLASKWQTMQKEFEEIRDIDAVTEISIGALDRMNTFMFADLYNQMMNEHPEIRLDIHTRHSRDIYRQMEDHRLDIGFVSGLLPVSANIAIRPLYYETVLAAACIDHSEKIISPEELDPSKEIYSRWSDEFEIWHDQLWPGRQYRIHVGTASMIPSYLNQPGRWALIPVSLVNSFSHMNAFSHYQLSVDAPKRTIYMLTQKSPRSARAKALSVFENAMIDFLNQDPLIRMISDSE